MGDSDEDSQASQDSMIVHDDASPPEPRNEHPSASQTFESQNAQTNGTSPEFQADWVPPWRIKSGRVPAARAAAATEAPHGSAPLPVKSHSLPDHTRSLDDQTSARTPVSPEQQPLTTRSAVTLETDHSLKEPYWTRSADLDRTPNIPASSNTFLTKSADFEQKAASFASNDSFVTKSADFESSRETPPSTNSTKLPWHKRFGSGDDLLKPHAPIPWRGHSDAEDNGPKSLPNTWRKPDTGTTTPLEPWLTPSVSSDSWRGKDVSPRETQNGVAESSGWRSASAMSDGAASAGLLDRVRSDGERSVGLGGRSSSPGSDASADERLEAQIMDQLEREAEREQRGETVSSAVDQAS